MEENPQSNEVLKTEPSPLIKSSAPFSMNSTISLHTSLDISKVIKVQNKHLLRLALILSWCWNPDNSALLRFCLKHKKNLCWLKRFTLEAYYDPKFHQNQIVKMVKSLKAVQSLTHFKIMGKIMNQDRLILPLMRDFKRLQYLTLDFNIFRDVDLPSFEKLFVSLKNVSRLKVIKVAFGSFQSSASKMIEELGRRISRLRALKGLKIELGQKYWKSRAEMGCAFSNWKACEPALVLSFQVYRGDLASQIFENIVVNLNKLPRLEKFELETGYSPDITDPGLDTLAVCIPQRLKSLRLDFDTCQKIMKEGILNLLSAIAKKSSLQDISLIFSSENKIDDEVIKELLRCLNRQKHLESLFLSFGKCNLISEVAMTRFLTFIPLNSNLKSLMLSLTWLKKNLTDDGLRKFGITLAKLKRLKTLGLSFRGCNEISDKGMNDLPIKFGSLEKLEKIVLNFQNCPSIRGKISENIFKEAAKLKDLEILLLDLRSCKHLCKHEVHKIISSSRSRSKCKLLVTSEEQI